MIKLQPTLKNYLWGGYHLAHLYGRYNGGDRISESWEVSVHKDGISVPLVEYLSEHPFAVDAEGSPFPILIKYIDALQNLSVQVHPGDDYARRMEGDNGKTEMWYIVDCQPGAGVFCGFRRDTTPEEFLARVADGTVESLLNFIPVKQGDCFLIEAGTVHAIGAGCTVCEVQQSSNVIYRVYDYHRKGADGKPRELHVDKALAVIRFQRFEDHTNTQPPQAIPGGQLQVLTQCPHFICRRLKLSGTFREQLPNTFVAVNILSGCGKINALPFCAGDSFFIPAEEAYTLAGEAEILLTTKNLRNR